MRCMRVRTRRRPTRIWPAGYLAGEVERIVQHNMSDALRSRNPIDRFETAFRQFPRNIGFTPVADQLTSVGQLGANTDHLIVQSIAIPGEALLSLR